MGEVEWKLFYIQSEFTVCNLIFNFFNKFGIFLVRNNADMISYFLFIPTVYFFSLELAFTSWSISKVKKHSLLFLDLEKTLLQVLRSFYSWFFYSFYWKNQKKSVRYYYHHIDIFVPHPLLFYLFIDCNRFGVRTFINHFEEIFIVPVIIGGSWTISSLSSVFSGYSVNNSKRMFLYSNSISMNSLLNSSKTIWPSYIFYHVLDKLSTFLANLHNTVKLYSSNQSSISQITSLKATRLSWSVRFESFSLSLTLNFIISNKIHLNHSWFYTNYEYKAFYHNDLLFAKTDKKISKIR